MTNPHDGLKADPDFWRKLGLATNPKAKRTVKACQHCLHEGRGMAVATSPAGTGAHLAYLGFRTGHKGPMVEMEVDTE